MKTKMFTMAVLGVLSFGAAPARADVIPPYLSAGPVFLQGNWLIACVSVGGNYAFKGATIPGGRIATLEIHEGRRGWVTVRSVRLPDITMGNDFRFAVYFGGPRRTPTTVRLSVSPAIGQPAWEVTTLVIPGRFDLLQPVRPLYLIPGRLRPNGPRVVVQLRRAGEIVELERVTLNRTHLAR